MPDEIAYTGVSIKTEAEDGISKASQDDMNAYAKVVANGGSAASMLKEMEPKPMRAEEDPNSIAHFIELMGSKQNDGKIEDSLVNTDNAEENSEDIGANFAAQFSIELEEK